MSLAVFTLLFSSLFWIASAIGMNRQVAFVNVLLEFLPYVLPTGTTAAVGLVVGLKLTAETMRSAGV